MTKEAIFVRVHSNWNPNRPWILSLDEFKSFKTQEEMIKKIALPIIGDGGIITVPTEISLVKLPIGTKIRKSVARPQDWPGEGHLPGGAIQYETHMNASSRQRE